jgi:hypothetical protein
MEGIGGSCGGSVKGSNHAINGFGEMSDPSPTTCKEAGGATVDAKFFRSASLRCSTTLRQHGCFAAMSISH